MKFINLLTLLSLFSFLHASSQEQTLYSKDAKPLFYINYSDKIIYGFNGSPVGSIQRYDNNTFAIHSQKGKHIGFLENGEMYSKDGSLVAKTKDFFGYVGIDPIKYPKRPFFASGFSEMPSYKPIKKLTFGDGNIFMASMVDKSQPMFDALDKINSEKAVVYKSEIYVPNIETFEPDWKLMQQALASMQARYDYNYKIVQGEIDKLGNLKLINKYNIQTYNDYWKKLQNALNNNSQLDLAKSEIMDWVMNWFKNFYEFAPIKNEISLTNKINSEVLRLSQSDPNTIFQPGVSYLSLTIKELEYCRPEEIPNLFNRQYVNGKGWLNPFTNTISNLKGTSNVDTLLNSSYIFIKSRLDFHLFDAYLELEQYINSFNNSTYKDINLETTYKEDYFNMLDNNLTPSAANDKIISYLNDFYIGFFNSRIKDYETLIKGFQQRKIKTCTLKPNDVQTIISNLNALKIKYETKLYSHKQIAYNHSYVNEKFGSTKNYYSDYLMKFFTEGLIYSMK